MVPSAPVPPDTLDPYELVRRAEEAVRLELDYQHTAQAASMLYDGVWRHLERNPRLLARLLPDQRFGPWLIRARLQLAHCLVDLGRFREARRHHAELTKWIDHAEEAFGFQGRDWEGWGLRWDDFWLEPRQVFVTELADFEHPEADWARAKTVLMRLDAKHGRVRRPTNLPMRLGNLKRSIADLEIAHGKRKPREIERVLEEALEHQEEASDYGMRAWSLITRAKLLGRLASWSRARDSERKQLLERMDRDIEEALRLVDHGLWPINLVNFTISATCLRLEHGVEQPSEGRLDRAARLILEHRFVADAERVERLPGFAELVSDPNDRRAIQSLARTHRAWRF